MKTALAIIHAEDSTNTTARRPRYQIYRQGQAGNYHPEFGTDSASDAVEAFLAAAPAFEGGAMHLWDHREQRSGAFVRWTIAKTDFGFPVSRRTNVFPDVALASLAREALEREATRETIHRGLAMGV